MITPEFILPSIANARELGGYVLPDGSRIKRGLLLRGGSLSHASDVDLNTLHDKYNVAHIFDFRTEGEIRKSPDRMIKGAHYVWLPAIDPNTEKVAGSSLPREAFEDLPNWLVAHASEGLVQKAASGMYSEMVMNEYTQLQYAAFLSEIVNTDKGAVYWHCSQGKDRTGLGAAFLLAALGADRSLIFDDYMASSVFYHDEFESLKDSVRTDEEREVLRTFITVNPRYFTFALDLIDRRFGSMDEYLKGPLCLTDGDFETLRQRYLEK